MPQPLCPMKAMDWPGRKDWLMLFNIVVLLYFLVILVRVICSNGGLDSVVVDIDNIVGLHEHHKIYRNLPHKNKKVKQKSFLFIKVKL